jgi:hypothetical protein
LSYLGAKNLTCTSTILRGCKQNIVSTFCFMILLPLPVDARVPDVF